MQKAQRLLIPTLCLYICVMAICSQNTSSSSDARSQTITKEKEEVFGLMHALEKSVPFRNVK